MDTTAAAAETAQPLPIAHNFPTAAVRSEGLLADAGEALLKAVAGFVSGYFVVAAGVLYRVIGAAGVIGSVIFPRSLIERQPLFWLIGATALVAVLSQSISGFFPDFSNPWDIASQVGYLLALGLMARAYLLYTQYADTFAGLRASIDEHPLERWLASHLNHPIDALFSRIWVANSILILPTAVLVIIPSTINYPVIVAYAVAVMIGLFPQEIVEHQNTHTRVFSPKPGASPRVKLVLKALQFYFEYVFALLSARVPHFYRVQHVYVHHVEDNGPSDTHTTMPYDRTSFLDFSLHAFWQSLDLVSGARLIRYLVKKGKTRQVREVVHGLAVWWAMILVIALFNPLAAGYFFVMRFLGGTFISLVTFYQHGLVDPHSPHEVAGHTIDYVHAEHGKLGFDYHVEHHQKPARHWAAYYDEHNRLVGEAGGHPAVLMQKETFGPLSFMAALWRRDYAGIAQFSNIPGTDYADRETLERLVKERARPIGAAEPSGLIARIDAGVSRAMAIAMPKSLSNV